MAGLNDTEKSLEKMEKSLGNINKRLDETEKILLNNSALASHLGFVDATGIKQYVAEMKTLFELYKNLKNINGIPELDAYFVGLKYTLLQVNDTITNIKKNSKATNINTPQGTLPSGKKSEFAYDNYKFNSKTHDDYIRQPMGEIKGIVDKQKLTLDLSVTGLENSEAQVKKLNGQLDKFKEKILGDSDVMQNSSLTHEQVDAYVESIKKAIPVQLEFAKSFDSIKVGKEHLKHFLEGDILETELGRISNYMIGNTEKGHRAIDPLKGGATKGNKKEVSTFDIYDQDKSINKRVKQQEGLMQGKVSALYYETFNKNANFLGTKIDNKKTLKDVIDTSDLYNGIMNIKSSKPANTDEAIDKLKKYNELIAATIAKTEELRVQTLATKKELAGTDNVKTYLDKKKELGKSAHYDSDYKAAEQSDEVKRYLEADTKLKSLNNAKKLLKSKLISGISTDTDDMITSVDKNNVPVDKIGSEVGNEQLRSLLGNTNTSELEQVIRFKPEIDKDALEKMKAEALALSSDTPDDFGIKTSDIDKMKAEALANSQYEYLADDDNVFSDNYNIDKIKQEALALSKDIPDDFGIKTSDIDKIKKEALALSKDVPDDFGARSDVYIANNEKKQQSDKKNAQVAQQTAKVEEQLAQQTASIEEQLDKKNAQVAQQTAKVEEQLAQQTASIEEQLDNKVTETKSKNKQKQISEAEKARREILDSGKSQGMPISASEKADIYTEHLSKAKTDSNDYYNILDKQLSNIAKAANDKAKQILDNTQREINQYVIDNNQSMPHDIKMNTLQTALDKLDKIDKAAAGKIAKLMATEIEKYNKSSISNNTTDTTKESIKNINEESKKYVSTQEALTGNKMNYDDQIAYYDKQIDKIKQLSEKTEDYIEILKLKRRVEEASKNSISDIQSKFNAKTTDFSSALKVLKNEGFNTSGIDKYIQKVNNIRPELLKAMSTGNADKAVSLWNEYSNAIDKVIGKSRAFEIAQQSAARVQQESIKKLYEETKNYVYTQETLSGQKISFSDQAAYYEQQAAKLKSLGGETREYIEVLKLKQQAEQKAADEARNSAEKEKQAYEESLNAAKQKITQGLSTIKLFADGINNAVNKVVSIIRTGIRLVNKVISTVGKIITTLGNGIKSIVTLFGNLGNRVRGTSNDFNFFKNSATELRSKIQLLKGAFNTLFNNSMITNASKLIGSVTTMNIIIGEELTANTIAWAESMERAFGVDANDLIAGLGEITGVLHGLGMKTKDVATGAVNFGIMARYLGMIGMAGGDANQVMTKLTSGMKGMTQSIDDLGLSVREAEMDSFLKNLKKSDEKYANIETSFSSLNEEARVYVRYAALMNQFANRFGKIIRNADGTIELKLDVEKFHKALNSVNGRLSIVKQSFNGMISTLGVGFSKIAAVIGGFLIPVFNFIEYKIKSIFAWLSKITGLNFSVDIDQASTLDFNTDGAEDASNKVDDLNDKLDKTKDKADKAKGSLQSFDRVNNVTSSSGSGSNSENNFDYSTLAADFEKLVDPKKFDSAYQSFLDKIKEDNKNLLDTLRDNFKEFAKKLTGRVNFDLGFDWKAIKKSIKNIWKNIKKLIKSWGTFFIEIGLKFLDDINIGKIITKFLKFISAVTDLAVAFSEVLIPVLRNFYDEVLSPIVKLVGEKIADAFDKATEKVKEWTKYLKDNKPELIEEWTEKLKHFFNVVTGKESANPEDGVLGTILEILNKVGKVIKALIPIVLKLASALGVFLKEEFLPWLNEKLGELAKWLTENKDKIVEFFKKVGGMTWDAFKLFVDLVGKLIDFVIKHPNTVIAFFAGLTAIKIGSWALSTASKIGMLAMGLSKFAAMFSSGGVLAGVGAKLSGLMSSAGGALSSAGPAIQSGLATAGTTLGSTASTGAGLAAAGGASIAGIAAGVAGIGAGIKDLYDASKETNEEIKEQKNWSGGTKIGMVGAGAATGAAIGSVVPGVGTAVGAAVGAGVGGVAAIFKGSDISEWLHSAWDNTLKPFFTETIPENFGKLVDGLKNFFTETVPQTISNIGTGISTFFTETVPEFFDGLWEGIKTFFTEDVPYALGYIAGSLKIFFTETVPNFFSGLWEDIKTFFTETIPTALETIKEKVTTFLTETVPNFFSGLWEDIKTFFTETIPTALETIKEKVTTFLTETIPNFFGGIWDKIETFFTETIPNAVETIKTKAKTFFTETIPTFFSGIWDSLKKFFTETIPNAVGTIKTSIKTFFTETIPNKIKSLFDGIGDLFGGAVDWIKNKFSSIGSNFSAGYDDAVNKTSAKSAKSVTSHAVGGSIAGGQLFIANENGQPELIGDIDGSPKTNVANNNMIIEAMTDGVFTGVYNALAEVNNQRGTVGGAGQNVNLKIDGFGLIDSSTLSELARMLAPYLSSNSKNIADINFSI